MTQESAISSPAPSRLLNILAIEDSPYDAELLLQELRRAGLNVRMDVAKTAVEVTAFLLGGSYDVVLSDFGLRGWTGVDALRVVRERHPDMPFILVTGTLGDEKAAECIKLGAADFVLKDRLARLSHAVVRALEEKARRAQQRAAEGALRESEERFRHLVEISPEAIFVSCRDRVVFINPACLKLFGAREEGELVGKTVADLVHPDFQQLVYRKIEQHEGTDSIVPGEEMRFRRLDGTLVDVEVSAIPLQWKGRASLQVVARDISKRKRAEEELCQSRQMLQSILDTIPQRVFWKDRNIVYLGCNTALALDAGLKDPAEIIGKNDYELAWKETAEVYRADDKQVMEHERPRINFEERQSRPDGSLLWLRTNKLPLRDREGKVIGVVGTYEDITESKRGEAERARLATAIEQSHGSVVITDLKGEVEFVNPAFTDITGYSREAVLGRNLRFLKSGKHDKSFYKHLWDTILAGENWRGEIINKKRDGTLYTQQMTITPVRDGAGKLANFIALCDDITQHRELEQQLLQAQKMEAVGRLAGGIAHDFNNLLTVIRGYAELMLEETDREKLRSRAQNIIKASDRTAGLTRQLLAFSRKQVLWPQVLDLNAVVAEARKMLLPLLGEDVRVIVIPGPKLGRVKADPGQIEQVLMNLAINARDAMPRGGKLVLETSNVECDDAYCAMHPGAQPGSYVMLAASDNGCGMDAETQGHIFEPFFTTKPKDKGTGLGLATVYGIVKQSGGHIWVYSEPGVGTTFKVYLPRVEEKSAVAPPPPHFVEPAAVSETILLVEDQEDLRVLAREFLEQRGYQVLAARNGAEALEAAGCHIGPIHLLLTDMVMPGMRGRELAERLCSSRPQMKVLFVSGYTDGSILENGELGPGAAFLEKPFSSDALVRKVRQVLNGAASGYAPHAGPQTVETAEPGAESPAVRLGSK